MQSDSSEPTLNPYAAPWGEVHDDPLVMVADLPLADRGKRLYARMLDAFVVVMSIGPGVAIMALSQGSGTPDAPESAPMAGLGALLIIAAILGLLAYNTYLLVAEGQTIGKRWTGTRIVTRDGHQATWVQQLLLRVGIGWIIQLVLACVGLNTIYSLADILFIYRGDRRCIHDLIAGTCVVEARHRPWA